MRHQASFAIALLPFTMAFCLGKSAPAQTNDALLEQGQRALQAKDFAGATEAFRQLVQRAPTGENYDKLANAEAAAGQLRLAIAHLQQSIRLGNRTSRAYNNLGILFMQAQEPAAAIEAFRQAVALDPANLSSRYGLGLALMTSGEPAAAAAQVQETLERAPQDTQLWALLVDAEFASGRSADALASTQKALQIIPGDQRLEVTLATTCLRFRAVQRARELLEDASESAPNSPEIALLLARASLMAAEPVEALAVLQGMVPADRKGTERLLLLGEAHALSGELDKAASDLRLALHDEPNNPQCLSAYAWLQNLTGHHEEAIATLTKARSILPKAPWIPYRIAVSYYFLGNYRQAEKACEDVMELDPKFAPIYFVRGLSRRKENNFEGSQSDFSQAVTLAPDNALFHRELAIALYHRGKPLPANQEFDIALRLDPKDAEGYFWRAKSMEILGEKEKAIADLIVVVNLNPGYAAAYAELADVYNGTGHPEKAAAVLAQLKQIGASSQPSGDDTLLHSLPDTAP
jgi:tetratricopeptide (TPR) repeat protein